MGIMSIMKVVKIYLSETSLFRNILILSIINKTIPSNDSISDDKTCTHIDTIVVLYPFRIASPKNEMRSIYKQTKKAEIDK